MSTLTGESGGLGLRGASHTGNGGGVLSRIGRTGFPELVYLLFEEGVKFVLIKIPFNEKVGVFFRDLGEQTAILGGQLQEDPFIIDLGLALHMEDVWAEGRGTICDPDGETILLECGDAHHDFLLTVRPQAKRVAMGIKGKGQKDSDYCCSDTKSFHESPAIV